MFQISCQLPTNRCCADPNPEPSSLMMDSNTNRVLPFLRSICYHRAHKEGLYLEDDDIAHIHEGSAQHPPFTKMDGTTNVRDIQTIELELQEMMKGNSITTCKRKFRTTESVVNAMRGRLDIENKKVTLGDF